MLITLPDGTVRSNSAPGSNEYSLDMSLINAQNAQKKTPTAQPAAAPKPRTFNLPTYNPVSPPTVTKPIQYAGPVSTTNYRPPEIAALGQLNQIDPLAEGTRYNTAKSEYGAIDPNNPITRAYNADFTNLNAGQLPPGVMREIQQDVRGQQAATGNDQGVAQAAQEAMTTGLAGYQMKNAARDNYNNYLNNTRTAALNYLGSGQTRGAAGQNYVDRALNQQAAAATGQMLPTYNPAVQQAPAFTTINPNAGSEFTQGSLGYLNAGVGAKPGSPDTSGQLIGAGIGAAGTLASSTAIFASTAAGAALFCQVARTVYGEDDPRYAKFRDWVLFKAPAWFRKLYARNADKVSAWLQGKPIIKGVFRFLMDKVIA